MAALFPERMATERLVLTPLHEVDVHRFYEICSHETMDEVTEYVTWTPHDHPKETAEFLADCEENWADGEGAAYVVRVDDGQERGPSDGTDDASDPPTHSLPIAGGTGIGVDWDRRVGTLGLWLRKRYWGRGYSGERAAALLAVAFDHLDLETVVVTHHAGNEKSRSAVETYVEVHGGRHEGLLRSYEVADQDVGGAVDGHRYSVTAEEFEANRGDPPTY